MNKFRKCFTIIVLAVIVLLSFVVCSAAQIASQEAANVSIKPLMKNSLTFNLPTTVGKMVSSIGKYTKFEYEDFDESPGGWGNRYIWQLANGLVLTAQTNGEGKAPKNKDEVEAIFLKAANKNTISNLNYGLALNQTTIADCKKIFGSKFKKKTSTRYKIYKDGLYTFLDFNAKGVLTEITQTTIDLDIAG